MGWTNPLEVASINVNGAEYTDWTSVNVVIDADNPYPTFQFECTEFTPVPSSFAAMQIKPGDEVTVTLAGQEAVKGAVLERHVSYDGSNHQIMIAGAGLPYRLTITSIPPENKGNYDGKAYKEIATTAAGYHGVPVVFEGAISDKPFEHSQHQPGELTWQFILRHANMRNVLLGSTAKGELLSRGQMTPSSGGDALVEGGNILRANAVWRDEYLFLRHLTVGQQPGHDDVNGDQANKGWTGIPGHSQKPLWQVNPADTPTSQQDELLMRAMTGKRFSALSIIEAAITVQGWTMQNGQLWKCRDFYNVYSPMLILNGDLLGAKKVIYDQRDGAGTTTTLHMINPEGLNGGLRSFAGPIPTF